LAVRKAAKLVEHNKQPDLISTAAAAALLGVTPQALYKWRKEGKGPQPYCLDGLYRYDRAVVMEYIKAARPKSVEVA
jgi:transposase-like protein